MEGTRPPPPERETQKGHGVSQPLPLNQLEAARERIGKKLFGWVFCGFFFGLKFHDLQMAPLGLGGGGAPRAWPRCHHGCARPWLRGQASSPWICIHGSVSYPNYCPESCMGAGWDGPALPCVPGTLPGSVRFHGERGGTGRGQGAAAAHNIPSFLWKF